MKNLLVMLVCFSVFSAASAMDIDEIRGLYSSVKVMIENQELYVTELNINSEGNPYPAVGIYNREFEFYWSVDFESGPEKRLLFIGVNSQYSAVEEYEEYLFNSQGELVFYFTDGGFSEQPERFYFDGNGLFRYVYNGIIEEHPDDEARSNADRILLDGENLFQSFHRVH